MKKKNPKKTKQFKLEKRTAEDLELDLVKQIIKEGAPPKGTNPLAEDLKNNNKKEEGEGAGDGDGDDDGKDGEVDDEGVGVGSRYVAAKRFDDLPISSRTKEGIKSARYVSMTSIQRASLPHALCGRDVLGAAKTGSGKTLAFLIPVLELLWREGWTRLDGLGALILSPTRELALQIFEVLCSIGHRHEQISAGLVIGGGNNLKEEQQRINHMNILVCTPGRLLQHLDQTQQFNCDNLRILVLDEADRMLDMGFKREINAIIESIPKKRQTLLFSATQSTSISQLARLSLEEPEFISVHATSTSSTPNRLNQTYVVCPLEEKLNTLYSFIRAHIRSKCLIFFATQKQVRFVNESFRKLRPGVPLLHIHGKMAQHKRQKTIQRFHEINSGVVLFATDLAARGLDFQGVDWVVQMDCPENVDTYIHRAGRTARYNSGGSALLILTPSEIEMVQLLINRKIPIESIDLNPTKSQSIKNSLQGMLLQELELKTLAQKAVRSYLRSVYLMENKQVFNVESLPHTEFAASFGLIGVPQIKFLETKKIDKHELMLQQKLERLYENQDQEDIIPVKPKKINKTKVQKLLDRKNANVLSESSLKLIDNIDDVEDVLVKKTENQAHLMEFEDLPSRKKNRGPSLDTLDLDVDDKTNFYEKAEEDLKKVDPEDRKAYHKRVSERNLKLKLKEKELEAAKKPQITHMVTIGSPVDSEEEFEAEDNYNSESDKPKPPSVVAGAPADPVDDAPSSSPEDSPQTTNKNDKKDNSNQKSNLPRNGAPPFPASFNGKRRNSFNNSNNKQKTNNKRKKF